MGLGRTLHDSPKSHEQGSRKLSKDRKLYRSGSLSSQCNNAEEIPLKTRERTPSGKSIRSRTASRAEYHKDLKHDLNKGINRNLVITCFLIVFGSSSLFGFNISVLNTPSGLIKDFYNETYIARTGSPIEPAKLTFYWSLITALYLPGGMIGAFSAGYLADQFGRKKAILISHSFAFIGAIFSFLCVTAAMPELLMLGRFFTGVNCGFATQLAPMYLVEISPFNIRGTVGTVHQLFITIGIFFGSLLGLREVLGTKDYWPYLLLINIVPALVSLIFLPFCKESPRFLMLIRKQHDEAEESLQFFRMTKDVSADMEEMETEGSDPAEGEKESYTMMSLLKSVDLRTPLFIAIFLQVMQQLSGINAIFFYSSSIYQKAGVDKMKIQYANLVTCAINVAMTIVSVKVMDIAGRRALLLFPMSIMVVVLGVITVSLSLVNVVVQMSYLSIVCIFAYVMCFAIGLGPIPAMLSAELFRQGPRPRAMSLAGFANWFFSILVALCFEAIQELLQTYTFLLFMGLMILFVLFVYFKIPETRGKTFEEIASQFAPGGKIEVEEFVEDFLDTDGLNGKAGLRSGADDVRASLTKSVENISQDPVV